MSQNNNGDNDDPPSTPCNPPRPNDKPFNLVVAPVIKGEKGEKGDPGTPGSAMEWTTTNW